MRKVLGVATIAVVAALVAWPMFWGRVSAQAPSPGQGGGNLQVVSGIESRDSGWRQFPFVYTVRYVCGTILANPNNPQLPLDPNAPSAPGTYLTEISVLNQRVPNITSPNVALQFLAVPAVDLNGTFDAVRPVANEYLPTNRAVTVDCRDIYNMLGMPGTVASPYVTGFLTIYSSSEVDVSAVYTTRS